MRRLFLLLVAGLLVLSLVSAASATVTVVTTVTKTKLMTVSVDVNITKNIILGIKQLAEVDTSAEADVTKNDTISGTTVVLVGGSPQAELLDTAFQNAIGIVSVNQAPGYFNNQGNAVAIAYASVTDPDLDAFLHAQVSVSESTGGGGIVPVSATFGPISNRLAEDMITDNAFENAIGVISVNQAAGNTNNQNNAVALAIGTTPVASLAEVDLGQTITASTETETDSITQDQISGFAFGAASGVISVNQAAGSSNNQANALAVTVASFLGPF
jgi:hypothetical protein